MALTCGLGVLPLPRRSSPSSLLWCAHRPECVPHSSPSPAPRVCLLVRRRAAGSSEMARWRDVRSGCQGKGWHCQDGLWLGAPSQEIRQCLQTGSRETAFDVGGRGTRLRRAPGRPGMSRSASHPQVKAGRGLVLPAISAFHLPQVPPRSVGLDSCGLACSSLRRNLASRPVAALTDRLRGNGG